MTVREARARYFEANGFSEAAYRERWVRFKLGPIPLGFPNPPSRQRAVPMHDLHHLATGYATTFLGEAEIGAWEVGGGCTDHWAAWVLNASAFGFGLIVSPRRVYRAFVRGRHSKTLYRAGWSDELLDLEVSELRHRIELDRFPATTWSDRLAFVAWVLAIAAPGGAALALALAIFH